MRFVDPPGAIWATQLTANPLIQNRCVTLDPLPNGDVVDGETALSYHFFQVSIAEGVPQIPANAE